VSIMKRIAILLSSLVLTACSLSLTYTPVSVKELLPAGSTARLTQAIEVPAGRSYVYIAAGKVVPFKSFNSVNIYKPYCEFHLTGKSDAARQVAVDAFRITRIVEWEDYVSGLDRFRLARIDTADVRIGGGVYIGSVDYNDAGLSTIMYATIISLRSDKQPSVKQMVCGHWDQQGLVEPLTLAELRTALGDLILLDVAAHKNK